MQEIKILIIIGFFSVFSKDCLCQHFTFGIGFDLNRTWIRQTSNVQSKFSNPHLPGFGVNSQISLHYLINKKLNVGLRPSLSILNTNSDVTSSNKMSFYNTSIEVGYSILDYLRLSLGIEYSYLIRRVSTFNGQSADFTFFNNNRSFVHPILNIDFSLHKNWNAYFRFVYFVQDIFNSGAIDVYGNIVGPIKVYPYVFSLGVNYSFSILRNNRD